LRNAVKRANQPTHARYLAKLKALVASGQVSGATLAPAIEVAECERSRLLAQSEQRDVAKVGGWCRMPSSVTVRSSVSYGTRTGFCLRGLPRGEGTGARVARRPGAGQASAPTAEPCSR
jgi:hypothetical protein